VQETDNALALATETYRQALRLAGDPPRPIACEAHLGLARINYQWNNLAIAEQHGQQCILLTRQMESVETFAAGGVLLARLALFQGDVPGAVAVLAEAEAFVRRHNFLFRMPDIAAVQVLTLLHQGDLAAAAQLAESHDLPLSLARVHLAQGEPATALALLEPVRKQAEARGWPDVRLQVLVIQAIACRAQGEMDRAMQLLENALALAEPGGAIRIFVDEGPPMAALLSEATKHGFAPHFVRHLRLALVPAEDAAPVTPNSSAAPAFAGERLSERELEVLRLLATELNGPEIAHKLMVSLNTMRTHTKNVFGKLEVNNRRAAVRRAEELKLL
jgi:LuxR family maltose regulon positive regulatory protein